MCVCVYVYIYCMYEWVCVCACMYIYIYIYIYVCVWWWWLAIQSYPTLGDPMGQLSPCFPIFYFLFQLFNANVLLMISIQRVFWQPLFLFPLTMPSIISCSSEAVCITWLKKVRRSFVILLSSDISGLIPFRISLLETLAVHGILKSLLQHHNSKASILSYIYIYIYIYIYL